MRFRIRGWILLCVTVALAAGHIVRQWSPATGTFLTEPLWVFEESVRNENELALALLCGPAPDFGSKVSVQEFVRALRNDYRASFDPDAVDDLESVGNVDCHFRYGGQKFGDWLLDTLSPLDLDFVVQRGLIHIVVQRLNHADGNRMVRIYPCPKVSSDSLIQSIESNCGEGNWIAQGGQDEISVIDNDRQSLLVVSTDYSTHQLVDAFLKSLYKASGIGWRNEARGLKQLPDVFMRRLAWWMDPPKTQSGQSNSFGCGCAF